MGYETQVEHAPETSLPDTSNAEDAQSLINKTVKEVTVDDNGKYVYPDNIDPVLKAAVAATKSYRDNQSGYTKSQQSLKESEAENVALRKQLADVTVRPLELTQEDKKELDVLYNSDPQAWRARMNKLETQQSEEFDTRVTEATSEARIKASGEHELSERYKYLDSFNENREVAITPEVLDNDIPPRILNRLKNNDVSFVEFLDEVSEYLAIGKVVSKEDKGTTTDLNSLNGSSQPSEDDKQRQGEIDYTNQTF